MSILRIAFEVKPLKFFSLEEVLLILIFLHFYTAMKRQNTDKNALSLRL